MRARAVTPVYGGDSVALQRDRAPLLLVKSKCRESRQDRLCQNIKMEN